MNTAATIRVLLLLGDPKRTRTAEISNWTGKAVAGPRTDLEGVLQRPELSSAGIYILLGVNPDSGDPVAYIGEAEIVAERLRQHKNKEFWSSVIAFVSKDENLTKAHIRYLEGRIIDEAKAIGRYSLENSQSSGAHLPESDKYDMEGFLGRVRLLLPVLGTELLTPITSSAALAKTEAILYCKTKDASAIGARSPNGFVIFKDSTAVRNERQSAKTQGPWILALRQKLINEEVLVAHTDELFIFTKDVEFSSPSAAAGVVRGGTAPGPLAWRDSSGKTLKDIDMGK